MNIPELIWLQWGGDGGRTNPKSWLVIGEETPVCYESDEAQLGPCSPLRDPVLLQTLFALTLVLQEQMDTFQAWGPP